MYAVAVTFTIRPQHVDRFKSRVVQLAAATLRHEPACQTFDVCFDPDDDLTVFLYQVFGTPEDYLVHLDSGHAQAFRAETASWIAEQEQRAFRRL